MSRKFESTAEQQHGTPYCFVLRMCVRISCYFQPFNFRHAFFHLLSRGFDGARCREYWTILHELNYRGFIINMLRTVLSRKLVFLKRLFSSQTEGEKKISEILKQRFPTAEAVQVTDVSGGCGAMYEIQIVSDVFHGKRTVMQHRMVNENVNSCLTIHQLHR
uniref:Uncharacterized protein LOC102806783 n=1 Tax=Saccoglossus kowalevskii TaxID=10224 RepID=A0ABM0MEG5_SACKO|nr:PREDICTED: uncharacterized protein LOC102806783 [Saccoglossus kowalevskii]